MLPHGVRQLPWLPICFTAPWKGNGQGASHKFLRNLVFLAHFVAIFL